MLTVLDNVFQKNVMPIAPTRRLGHIDTHFESKSLLNDYEQLAATGFPNMTLSGKHLRLERVVTACRHAAMANTWTAKNQNVEFFSFKILVWLSLPTWMSAIFPATA